jgi:hypothetical protein
VTATITNLSRRSALAGLAAAIALSVDADASTEPDPIYGAIEEYKAAVAERYRLLNLTWDGGNPALIHLPENHPDCVAAEEAHDEAMDLNCSTSFSP